MRAAYTVGIVEGVLSLAFGAMCGKMKFGNEIREGNLLEIDVFVEGPKTGAEID